MSIDFSNAWKTCDNLINGAISLLPNLVLAILIFAAFVVIASLTKSLTRRVSLRRHRNQNIGLLLGRLAQMTIVIVGFLVAFSTVAPSFRAGDLIKMLGIGSVAIGFAFQNILQNFLAGILLLLQESFQIGDSIRVNDLEGTVDDIQTRATIISTADGHRVVVPNAVLFTNPVVVAPAAARRAA
jgi:small conductance mechanosensitive channel